MYDMVGNVGEWVWDKYDDYPLGPVTDPTGPVDAFHRVRRGGDYFDPCDWARPPSRSFDTDAGSQYRGFRVVRTVLVD